MGKHANSSLSFFILQVYVKLLQSKARRNYGLEFSDVKIQAKAKKSAT